MNKLLLFFISMLLFVCGCSSTTPTKPYTGRVLNIGIIGNPPTIMENRTVKFVPITFEDLVNDNYKNYDAVFIMKEKLAEASNDNYSKIYAELHEPIIFIGTDTLMPFISNNTEYLSKDFQKGSAYSSGLIEGVSYGFGLYNDKENEAALKLFYSDLFRLIE